MRITKSLLMSAVFALFLGTASANTNPEFTSARLEIKELITKSNIAETIDEETIVNVTFMVNAKNEIIILSTDKEDLDGSIKEALNYKKLKSQEVRVNVNYTLPVKLKK